MPIFNYKAKDKQGKTIKDTISANDSSEALLKIRQNYPLVISIKEGKLVAQKIISKEKVTLEIISFFFRELATLIDAGIPLVRSLVILGNQKQNPYFSKVILDMRDHIEAGENFADALKRYPNIFTAFYISMVSIGEAGGILAEVF